MREKRVCTGIEVHGVPQTEGDGALRIGRLRPDGVGPTAGAALRRRDLPEGSARDAI